MRSGERLSVTVPEFEAFVVAAVAARALPVRMILPASARPAQLIV
jgi:hypothetical protein